MNHSITLTRITILSLAITTFAHAARIGTGATSHDPEKVRTEGRTFTMPSDSEIQSYDDAHLGNLIRRRFAVGLAISEVQRKTMVTSVRKWQQAHADLFDSKTTAEMDAEYTKIPSTSKDQAGYGYLRAIADAIAHNAAVKGGITTPDSLNYPVDLTGATDETVKAWITLTLTSTRADYKKVDQLFDRLNTFEVERFPAGTAYDSKVASSRRDINQGGATKDLNSRKVDHLFLVLEGLRKQPRKS